MRVEAPVPTAAVTPATSAFSRAAGTEAKPVVADGDSRRADPRLADEPEGSGAKPDEPLDEALRKADEALRPHDMELRFSRDEDTNQIVVALVDAKSGETLRQMPDEAALRVAASLGKLRGLVLDRQA